MGNEAELSMYQAHKDTADSYERAIVDRTKQLMDGHGFNPLRPDNIREALGEIDDTTLGTIALLMHAKNFPNVGAMLTVSVNKYWATAARKQAEHDIEDASETGVFLWIGGRMSGRIAGGIREDGYKVIRIDNILYLAHRLAWLYETGSWPSDKVDHINRVRSDNKIANLRECSNAQNCQNMSAHKDGSGLIGAHWSKVKRKWVSSIGINYKVLFLGHFETKEAAHNAYMAAKRDMHQFCGVTI